MEITVKRSIYTASSTIGELSVDGAFECYTLEDTVRPAGEKVFGQTAIPAGTYNVIITHSPHFGRDLPLLLSVPNFSGVRIHSGNRPQDTEGCILVGQTAGPESDFIGSSRAAFAPLFGKITAAVNRGEAVEITIS